ncbi:MAG: ribbon-helix-helix domain-containing protein [Chloroflexota bacterium]
MTITLPDDLAEKLTALARHQNRSPEDVMRDLLATVPEPPAPEAKQKRILGLNRGSTIYMSDDFDDYLGDDFWFGES